MSTGSLRVDASPLRLALFTDTYAPHMNGVARTLSRLVSAIEARGGVVQVFAPSEPPASRVLDAKRQTQTTTALVTRYPSRPFWAYPELRLSWPSAAHVAGVLAAFHPTLVHAATEFGVGLAGRRAARRLGVPFVSSYHTQFAAYARYYRLGLLARAGWAYLRWFHNGGARTYAPTQAVIAELATHGFLRMAQWSRGVDTARFAPGYRSAALRAQWGATDDTLVVAYVGRLAAEKGLDVGLDAVRRAASARPGHIRFVAVGDGPYATVVREGAPAGSWIPGALDGEALSTAYASADVLLFPSTTDTFGNVILEGMASGLPVLGADVGPTRELVLPNRGWVAPPSDPGAFARVLVALVDDRTRCRMASTAAVAFAGTQRWDAVWDTLCADYLRLHAPAAHIGRSLGPGGVTRLPASPSAAALR